MKWNLEWLRTFKAIYETGTMTAAAQNLFVSQPGVSLHLNALEAYTGLKLFERSAKKMTPTEKGKILYNYVVTPLEKLERGEKHFHKRSRQERNTISVGMCFETFQYTLEKYIPTLPFNLIIKFGDYPQMLQDLDTGLLDLIITPHKGTQPNIEYKKFAKERIILVAGIHTDTQLLQFYLKNSRLKEAVDILKKGTWYGTSADMGHLLDFWKKHFGEHPDFSTNYIVPNISSIIRCLSVGEGFAIVPDFLCKEAILTNKIKTVWEGYTPIENILYFGTRKKTIYQQEIKMLEKLLTKEWSIQETEISIT